MIGREILICHSNGIHVCYDVFYIIINLKLKIVVIKFLDSMC